jgi:hypothetical protein
MKEDPNLLCPDCLEFADQLSPRDAINLANANGGDQTISFDPSLFASGAATISLTQGVLLLDDGARRIGVNPLGRVSTG